MELRKFKDKKSMLPGSVDIIKPLERIIQAFENVVQVELIKVRWEEIKKLQSQPIMLMNNGIER